MTVATLQPDETAGLDCLLDEANPDTNDGTGGFIWVGDISGSGTRKLRTLIKFDLSSIPDGSTINSAVLTLTEQTFTSGNDRTVRVYRVKRAWTESGATWNTYDGTNAWGTAGCDNTTSDREATDIGSRACTIAEGGSGGTRDWTLTASVKSDLDLGNGWLIKSDTESDDGHKFSSSSAGTAGDRPKLVIDYTAPASGGVHRATLDGGMAALNGGF